MEQIAAIEKDIADWITMHLTIVILIGVGLFLTGRSVVVQVRLFPEMIRTVLGSRKGADGGISSFQAFAISLAARVGIGNVFGVAAALLMGGPGAIFWMWVVALVGMGPASFEATLAQIFKERGRDFTFRGGPAYYIEDALHNKALATAFVIFLLLTYSFGFNLLCSYNVQSTFSVYSFYNPSVTPAIIGAIMAALVGICVLGGSKAIEKAASLLVPVMGVAYVVVTVVVLVMNYQVLPQVIETIFADAFNFRAIFGGIGGGGPGMGG